MRKLQDEVRSIVPRGQEIVGEIHMNNMRYLRAVIKESLRLHPVVPLLAPHLAMADCIIDGYMVPAGTRVIVNAGPSVGTQPPGMKRKSSYLKDLQKEAVICVSTSRGIISSSCHSGLDEGCVLP
jgi:hypothetical protein